MNKRIAIDGNPDLIAELREGEPLDLVVGGEIIGRATPVPKHDVAKAKVAAARIVQRSSRMSLAGLKIKDLIDEGRP
jgi:hypothetical protein